MRNLLWLAVAITALTLFGLLALPSVYHFALATFGLGNALVALVFALIIEAGERNA